MKTCALESNTKSPTFKITDYRYNEDFGQRGKV
jgi:hypothetical protein